MVRVSPSMETLQPPMGFWLGTLASGRRMLVIGRHRYPSVDRVGRPKCVGSVSARPPRRAARWRHVCRWEEVTVNPDAAPGIAREWMHGTWVAAEPLEIEQATAGASPIGAGSDASRRDQRPATR